MWLAIARPRVLRAAMPKRCKGSKASRVPQPGAGDRVVLDRGAHKLAKDCVQCGRVMTWRKKWERNWPQVIYCSDRCKKEAAQARRRAA